MGYLSGVKAAGAGQTQRVESVRTEPAGRMGAVAWRTLLWRTQSAQGDAQVADPGKAQLAAPLPPATVVGGRLDAPGVAVRESPRRQACISEGLTYANAHSAGDYPLDLQTGTGRLPLGLKPRQLALHSLQ
ncbi:hypothetical protein G8770_20120 [Aestuariicella hydrocarbonica]|uniref:Uncharacterized protein n=1 Tax=Pseudomaricurvus hydrocarbonicus TaxID=1470433 RepID=A0A9E5MPA9_9GAMM|nr:hypothetical protein [Aestuariicella hydrocarbonica]NHO67859.1 hypothetical protein [Aestuariicella hydrocarbonica]